MSSESLNTAGAFSQAKDLKIEFFYNFNFNDIPTRYLCPFSWN